MHKIPHLLLTLTVQWPLSIKKLGSRAKAAEMEWFRRRQRKERTQAWVFSSSSFLPQATLTRQLTRPTSQVGFYLDLRSRPRLIPSIHRTPPALGRRAGREGEREGGEVASDSCAFLPSAPSATDAAPPPSLPSPGWSDAGTVDATDGRRATRLLPESFFPLPPAPHQSAESERRRKTKTEVKEIGGAGTTRRRF